MSDSWLDEFYGGDIYKAVDAVNEGVWFPPCNACDNPATLCTLDASEPLALCYPCAVLRWDMFDALDGRPRQWSTSEFFRITSMRGNRRESPVSQSAPPDYGADGITDDDIPF